MPLENGEYWERRSTLAFLSCWAPLLSDLMGCWKKGTLFNHFFLVPFPYPLFHFIVLIKSTAGLFGEEEGVFPFHFLEAASWIVAQSGLWELLSNSTIDPPHPISLHFSNSRHSALLSLVCFWQSFMLAAICSTSFFYYQHHASDASISFIHLTNALGKPSLSIKHTLKLSLYTVAPAALSL